MTKNDQTECPKCEYLTTHGPSQSQIEYLCKALGEGLVTKGDPVKGKVLERKVVADGKEVFFTPVDGFFSKPSPYPPAKLINDGNCPYYKPMYRVMTKILRHFNVA